MRRIFKSVFYVAVLTIGGCRDGNRVPEPEMKLSPQGECALKIITSFYGTEIRAEDIERHEALVRDSLLCVSNIGERMSLLHLHEREILGYDLIGDLNPVVPEAILKRCDVVEKMAYPVHRTISRVSTNRAECIDFDLEMCRRLNECLDRLGNLARDQRKSAASGDLSSYSDDVERCLKDLKNCRQFWIWQNLDAPVYDIVFKGLSAKEKKRYFERIKDVIGHYPKSRSD